MTGLMCDSDGGIGVTGSAVQLEDPTILGLVEIFLPLDSSANVVEADRDIQDDSLWTLDQKVRRLTI